MKVKELIKDLQKANQDAKIFIAGSPLVELEILSIYSPSEGAEINDKDKVLYIDVGVK